MGYKKSDFNYVQQNGKSYLIYNTLYNSLVRLSEWEFAKFSNPDDSEDELGNLFVENGLWVDDRTDERTKYLACAEVYTLYAPRPLSITITTTLRCNARCAYCYEKGVDQTDIGFSAADKIINFIKNHNKANEVQLVWFGGEPLMNMSFMDLLCSRLNDEEIVFSSYIISNGSLLNKEIIKTKFRFWNIKNMQITLDGTEEVYKSIKKYRSPEEGEYYSILNSIRIAAEEGVFVNIRLNIGRANRNNILELVKELDAIFYRYNNVVFYPAFITGEKEPLSDEECVEYIKQLLLSMKNIKKLTAGTKFYSLPRMHACMNGDPQSFSIDVNGNVYSCEHYVGKPDHRIGKIEDNFNGRDSRGMDVRFQDECQNCVFLPKCFGGCEANRMEGDIPCMIEKYIIKAYLQIL